MIRNEPSITLLSGINSSSTIFSFKSGEIVSAEVIGSDSSGKLLLKIAGKTIAATGIKHFQSGDIFQAKVLVSGSTIFLQPLSNLLHSPSSLVTQLGLPDTPIHIFLVNLLQSMQIRLIPEKIQYLARISSKFHGKEKEAATAAAILEERGIELSEKNIAIYISALEGRLLEEDRDFIAYVNRKSGVTRHWIVLPFEKTIATIECCGSVSFLLDLSSSKIIEACILLTTDQQHWSFTLTETNCVCNTDPLFNPVSTDKFTVYLKEILVKFNIVDVIFQSLDVKFKSKGVDVEV